MEFHWNNLEIIVLKDKCVCIDSQEYYINQIDQLLAIMLSVMKIGNYSQPSP